VCADSAQASSGSPKKKSSPSSSNKTHRAKSSRRSSRRERGQKVPAPDRISEIQQALAKDGSFVGAPNGKWDAATMDAMKKFQEAHGLNPSGKLDAKTLQHLGLGSQTAGVAPPLPPVSSSALKAPAAQLAQRQQ
jgi:peptidoglycan hydrolase-like protein with peptidoglycan-binding domain